MLPDSKPIIEKLDSLCQSTKILQLDQTLQAYLIRLRACFAKKIETFPADNIERILLLLLRNNEDLDIACSLEIGRCFFDIYASDYPTLFFLLFSEVTKKPTQSNILAFKLVLTKFGSSHKSGLGQLFQIFPTLKKTNFIYSSLIMLRTLYKVCSDSIDKNVTAVFHYAKTAVSNSSEKIQIAALRLLQVLVSEPEVQNKKVLSIAQKVFSNCKSKFIEIICAELVAHCAAQPFLRQMDEKPKTKETNQISDFAIKPLPKNHILKESFDIFLMFKNYFSTIFGFFLDRIPPDYVYLNLELLFNFVIQNSISDVTQLLSFFGRDIRSCFFSAVKSQKVINFYLLRLLIYDDSSAKEAAGVAHDRILSTSPEERKEVKKFFASLSYSYPQAALESLHVAVHYIAMPPDESPEMMNEYLGQAIIASVLMALIGQKWEIEMPLVKKFVDLVINEHRDNEIYLESLFIVFTTQTPEFLAEYPIQQLLNEISAKYISKIPTDFNIYPIRLIEYLLNFYSIHSFYENIKPFFDFCFQLADHLSIIALISLIRLLQTIDISESESLSIATYLLNKCGQLHFSLSYIKSKIPEVMKIQEELFIAKKESTKNQDIEAILFFANETQLSAAIIDVIPYLFKKMNQKMSVSFINTMISHKNKFIGYMCLLSILQEATSDQSLISQIPENIHLILTKATTSKTDDLILQVVSECIATYLSIMPSFLSSYFSYLNNDSVAICFIETSLARHVNMNDDQVLHIVLRASSRLKNMSLAVYALHELSAIYEAKSIQLMNLMIGEQQCQQLLTFIIGNDIPVFTMYYVSICFEKLIPILLPTLSETTTMDMILVALNEFRNTSIPFYKQFFYDLFRSFFAFAKEISDYFIIRIPPNQKFGHNQLSECGAFADVLRYEPSEYQVSPTLFPSFFVLLQRTRSKHLSNLLLSVAESVCQTDPLNLKELEYWFKLTNQILSKNSMVGFKEIEVEPNTTVKQTALLILKMFLKPLATSSPFLSEWLDDLISSTIRAIETKIVELYETSYAILTDCIYYFASFITEQHVYLLSLYESQFLTAIRSAFPFSLDVAYTFIIDYIDFQFKDYHRPKQKENCQLLIKSIIQYLQNIKKVHPTTGYNAIISKIATISEEYTEIFDNCSKDFLENQAQHIKTVMLHAMNLRSETMTSVSRTKEWQKITEFRKGISPFYSNFLVSFVWLRKMFQAQMKEDDDEPIKIDSIIDFFLNEINSSEGWRTSAAFRAFSSFLKYFGEDINGEVFQSLFNTCAKVYKQNKAQILPMMPDFLQFSALLTPKESSIWQSLAELAISSKCYAITIGRILQNYDSVNGDMLIKLVEFLIKELNEKTINEDEAIAIITIMCHKWKCQIRTIVNCIFTTTLNPTYEKFYVESLIRATAHFPQEIGDLCNESAIESISNFLLPILFSNEKAIRAIAQIVLLHEKTGFDILKRGIVDEVVQDFDKSNDAMTLLNFYHLILLKFDKSKDWCEKIVHASLSLIIKCGSDRNSSLQITSKAVEVIKLANALNDEIGLKTYEKFADSHKETILRILRKYTAKKTVKKLTLRRFAQHPVRRGNNELNDGEWQNLEDLQD